VTEDIFLLELSQRSSSKVEPVARKERAVVRCCMQRALIRAVYDRPQSHEWKLWAVTDRP
jgi:hypothetical protein